MKMKSIVQVKGLNSYFVSGLPSTEHQKHQLWCMPTNRVANLTSDPVKVCVHENVGFKDGCRF